MTKDNSNQLDEQAPVKYWLSLDQWRKDPEFNKLVEKEFMSSPLQEEEGKGGWARREFLKLMGASIAMTSFGCVRRPAQMIVPYAKKPQDMVLGLPNYYASSFMDGHEGFGTLVVAREGRPIKIEGNAEHPLNRGGMSARAHAHILSLYDPERLTGPKRNLMNAKKSNHETVSVSYESLDKEIVEQLKRGGVALLLGPNTSPSTQTLLSDFSTSYGVKTYHWSPLTYEDISNSQKYCYGRELLPQWNFSKAKYIISVNCDFLGVHVSPTANARAFAARRKPDQGMNKLIVFESLMSLTGTNADERFRIKPQDELTVLMALVHELLTFAKPARYANEGALLKLASHFAQKASSLGLPKGLLSHLAQELWSARGNSLVVTGGSIKTENSLAAQVAANLLNSILENDGVTVEYEKASTSRNLTSHTDLQNLIDELNKNQIKTVIIHNCNPGYAASNSGFIEALKKAEMVVYSGDRMDETGVQSDYVVPDHHPLENWDDSEAISGVVTLQQPTIEPLYQTRSFQDSVLVWSKAGKNPSSRVKDATTWYDYLRAVWKARFFSQPAMMKKLDFEDFWVEVLHQGFLETKNTSKAQPSRSFNLSSLKYITEVVNAVATGSSQLLLYPTVGLRDGSLANVSWLQEFPDPVTKICWDNYLTVSPQDAVSAQLKEGDLVQLKAGEKNLEVPVHIQPGQADGVFGLAVGYGRTRAGKVANGVGKNAYDLMSWKKNSGVGSMAAQISKTGRCYDLACVQGHHSMEGRQIVVEATLAQYQKDPGANIHRHKMMTMWSELPYPNNKWGMVIDLNSCTGCGACVVACQSENNVPTVGKKYVLAGREMHWIRIDRYYVGSPADPAVVHQPIVCMHCDNAPCEAVCPVMATVHSDEGTNDMIYNRCVGTRYCSNNCPYKVRRFNWFNFVKPVEKPLNYAMNPEVTVRARGVMEKCTFCIHRIRSAKSQAKTQEKPLKDGDIKTACQQSCPADAIMFGDLNNPESQVRKLFDEKNSYALLEELNTKPAVRYRSKIRNANELKGEQGHSTHSSGEGQHS
ncbi:MAG: TAT-variant-translocated molybdopterin oxidoreductase [Bdellovibrionales bacterium]|nr:TAT-variant-translocated molybdopterin oxidoreductase [Bdellovibrionales bacterium]